MRMTMMTVVLSGALAAAAAAQDSERKVRLADVPPAVQQAIKQQSAGATLRGVAREVENGRTRYEAELEVNGRSKDVTFEADGRIVSVEEKMTIDQIPAAARDAIRKAAIAGKLGTIERVTEGGTTFYEAHITTGGKKTEVKVDAFGQAVK